MYDPVDFFLDFFALSLLLLPLYRAVPSWALRRGLLGVAGALLLASLAPRLAVFYLVLWLVTWACQRGIGALREHPQVHWFFRAGLVLLLAPMVTWKLSPHPFIVHSTLVLHQGLQAAWPWGAAVDAIRSPLLFVGLSFATFRALDLFIKVRGGRRDASGLGEVLFYGFFPAVQAVGPVIQIEEVEKDPRELADASSASEDLVAGLWRIMAGFAKLYLLAMPLQWSRQVLLDVGAYRVGALELWATISIYALYTLFNFSAYSDLAIGSARLYGFRLLENFNYPFMRGSLQAFWANWHMSLTRWAQRNVFVMAGGFRKKTQYRAIVMTMMTIALWHDLSLSQVLFGMAHASVLCLERYYNVGTPAKEPAWRVLFGWAWVFLFLALTIPLGHLPPDRLPALFQGLVGMGAGS